MFGNKTHFSPGLEVEVKESVEIYLHSPNTPSWRGAQLKESAGTTLPSPLLTLVLNCFLESNSIYGGEIPKKCP
jgi:hypothetical protein